LRDRGALLKTYAILWKRDPDGTFKAESGIESRGGACIIPILHAGKSIVSESDGIVYNTCGHLQGVLVDTPLHV